MFSGNDQMAGFDARVTTLERTSADTIRMQGYYFGYLRGQIDDLSQGQRRLTSEVNELREVIVGVADNVSEMKGHMSVIKTDMSAIKSDVSELKTGMMQVLAILQRRPVD